MADITREELARRAAVFAGSCCARLRDRNGRELVLPEEPRAHLMSVVRELIEEVDPEFSPTLDIYDNLLPAASDRLNPSLLRLGLSPESATVLVAAIVQAIQAFISDRIGLHDDMIMSMP